jgi:hypothetical protein
VLPGCPGDRRIGKDAHIRRPMRRNRAPARECAAVWKFFLPRYEEARDALEIFVTAEQHERSHMRRILRIAGCQERESAGKTERNHGNGSGAEASFEPWRPRADRGYRGSVHAIVGKGGESGRQNREAAGGQCARKIHEPLIVRCQGDGFRAGLRCQVVLRCRLEDISGQK